MPDEKPDENVNLHGFEVLHASHMVAHQWDRFVEVHPFVEADADLKAKAEQIGALMADFYQEMGRRTLQESPGEPMKMKLHVRDDAQLVWCTESEYLCPIGHGTPFYPITRKVAQILWDFRNIKGGWLSVAEIHAESDLFHADVLAGIKELQMRKYVVTTSLEHMYKLDESTIIKLIGARSRWSTREG